MSVRPENNYKKDEYLHNTFQTKSNRIRGEIVMHKNELRNYCDGERLTFCKTYLTNLKLTLQRLWKEKAQKAKRVILIFIRNIDYTKPMDTRFKLNKSRWTKYPE